MCYSNSQKGRTNQPTILLVHYVSTTPLLFTLCFDCGEKVLEVRGGSVYFEPGALGGRFVGILFIDDLDIIEVGDSGVSEES